MPTYLDTQTGRKLQSEQPLDDSELEEAFGGDKSSPLERAGSYVGGKVMDWANAGQNVIGDVYGAATGKKMFPGERTNWQRAQDALTTAGPLLGPEMTAAGTIAGAGGRAAGLNQEDAEKLDTGTQLATGGVQALRGAAGVGRAVAGKFGKVAQSMAQRGTLLHADAPGQTLFWALAHAAERFTPNSAERNAAEGVMDAIAHGRGLTYGDLDNALTRVQGVSHDSTIAGILRDARDALTRGPAALGGSEARDLASAYRASGRANMSISRVLPGKVGYAARALGINPSVGGALAAAGPAARTAASLSGPAIKSLGSDQDPVDTTPSEGQQPEVPATTPQPSSSPRTKEVAVRGPFGREIAAVASVVKIPPQLLHAVVRQESSGNPNALSHPGPDQVPTPAHGLMQITPGTFDRVAGEAGALLGRPANIANPLDNLVAGGLLWKKYLDKSGGDLRTAAHLYHGGENPAYWGAHTQKYGDDILQKFAEETQ